MIKYPYKILALIAAATALVNFFISSIHGDYQTATLEITLCFVILNHIRLYDITERLLEAKK